MHKLAMVYEARHRQLQNEILTSPQRSHSVLGGSVSFIGNGSYCYPGNESVANTTITTIHDWVSNQNHSINYQVEREKEIQRRKLPGKIDFTPNPCQKNSLDLKISPEKHCKNFKNFLKSRFSIGVCKYKAL